ncbi:MAG: methyltransferase domain-containing protein [bacterium]
MKITAYDIVAKFYDKVIGRHDDLQDYTLKKIKQYNKKAGSLLELGCGTGENLKNLQSKFEITGIDISDKMLKIAKKKIPGGKFYRGDIRSFKLRKKFDVIICLYDTVNHLTLFSELKKLFANVKEHLNESGIFIFDINTIYKLNNLSEISPLVYKFDKNFLIVEVRKLSLNIFNWTLKIFEYKINNNYKLHEVNIKEAVYDLSRIETELKKTFVLLNVETEDHKKINNSTERVFFVCKRRETLDAYTLDARRETSNVKRQTSNVKCQTSNVKCQTSNVKLYLRSGREVIREMIRNS